MTTTTESLQKALDALSFARADVLQANRATESALESLALLPIIERITTAHDQLAALIDAMRVDCVEWGDVVKIAAQVGAAGFNPYDVTPWRHNVDAGFRVSERVAVGVGRDYMNVSTTDGEGASMGITLGKSRPLEDLAGLLADLKAATQPPRNTVDDFARAVMLQGMRKARDD